MKEFRKRLLEVPHLFGKVMVVCCVACGGLASFYALRILSRTGQDASDTLSVILGFFGGELALMFGRCALQGKRKSGPASPEPFTEEEDP